MVPNNFSGQKVGIFPAFEGLERIFFGVYMNGKRGFPDLGGAGNKNVEIRAFPLLALRVGAEDSDKALCLDRFQRDFRFNMPPEELACLLVLQRADEVEIVQLVESLVALPGAPELALFFEPVERVRDGLLVEFLHPGDLAAGERGAVVAQERFHQV